MKPPDELLVVASTDAEREELVRPLERAGYAVRALVGPVDAPEAVGRSNPIAQVIDLAVTDRAGMPLWAALRRGRRRRVPTLIVTRGGADAADVDATFPRQVDDCIVAPFRAPELLYRVQRLLRPSARPAGEARRVRMGELEVDLTRREASLGGRPVSLGPTELGLLLALARQPEVVQGPDELVAAAGLRSGSVEGGRQTLRTTVSRLRHKLEQDPQQPRYLHSVRRGGYMLGVKGVRRGADVVLQESTERPPE
jgi:two-component system phosphate regulon response regulator PhoB/two-component system alkaline phosphatase synthesis response regulator PhoP